ncbi:unnamed protein product [Aureobasidium mustum]|uniref:Uncharacterized protein n=1 Tax=Aureobasidium mustum TaxID=2773714 RepID=A0A9N8K5M5_9PEZI|nr:unnamed protein product [Aureobasidium mustum]
MIPSTSLLALPFLPISVLASNVLDSRATCTNFSLAGKPYTIPGPATYIISSGVVCKDTQNCTILAGGFVNVPRLLNNTQPDESVVNDIFALVSSSTNIDFEASTPDNISPVTQTFAHGTAGFVIFTPIYRCVAGTLSGCGAGNDTYTDGTVIQACTPDNRIDENHITGTVNKVTTDEASAKDVTCNPANVSSAADAPNKECMKTLGVVTTSGADFSAMISTTAVGVAMLSVVGVLLV